MVFGEIARVGAVLGVYSAIVTPGPALAANTPEQRVLDIGNVPAETKLHGSFKECAKVAKASVTTNVDVVPKYGWPNTAGESLLTKAGVSLEYSLDPVVDYDVTPNKVTDTASPKHCAGTRTEETKIRVQAGGKQASRRVFSQIIRGNASASVSASVDISAGKQCSDKNKPKQVKISRTQTTKYREGHEVSSRKRTTTRLIPCISHEWRAVPAQR